MAMSIPTLHIYIFIVNAREILYKYLNIYRIVVLWIVGWTKLKYFRLYMVVYGIMREKLSLPKKPSSRTTYLECPTGLVLGY